MNEQQLLQLKQQITSAVMPLILNGNGSPEERSVLLLNLIQTGNADEAIYQKAFEVINNIEDADTRLNSLFDLLREIEVDIERVHILPIDDADPSGSTTANSL